MDEQELRQRLRDVAEKALEGRPLSDEEGFPWDPGFRPTALEGILDDYILNREQQASATSGVPQEIMEWWKFGHYDDDPRAVERDFLYFLQHQAEGVGTQFDEQPEPHVPVSMQDLIDQLGLDDEQFDQNESDKPSQETP